MLGVSATAGTEELRRAYRRLARELHPDVAGNSRGTMIRMAEVNRAWSVLSDPVSRRAYDASRMRGAPGNSTASSSGGRGDRDDRVRIPPTSTGPARFPWRMAVVMVVIGIVAVLFLQAVSDPPVPGVPDQILEPGSCVVIDAQQLAVEVACAGPHDYVVTRFIPTDGQCPLGVASFKDRQGMGAVCVVPADQPGVATTGSAR